MTFDWGWDWTAFAWTAGVFVVLCAAALGIAAVLVSAGFDKTDRELEQLLEDMAGRIDPPQPKRKHAWH